MKAYDTFSMISIMQLLIVIFWSTILDIYHINSLYDNVTCINTASKYKAPNCKEDAVKATQYNKFW